MPIFLFCGNPHGHFCDITDAVHELRLTAVILFGDIERYHHSFDYPGGVWH